MAKPILTIIAGCNGSGKSSFSEALTPSGTLSFDYDKAFLKFYNSQDDSELRERISHNRTRQLLEAKIELSTKHSSPFTYETNFNSSPLHWPRKFKTAEFELVLVYFCLSSIDEAKRRVQIRVENGGHFVPHSEIEERFHLGYKHLNQYWTFFDQVHLFDTSAYKETQKHLPSIVDQNIEVKKDMPEFLFEFIPLILK